VVWGENLGRMGFLEENERKFSKEDAAKKFEHLITSLV
jgi:hypothetical protein